MEDKEHDEILYRLDERTERIENELTRRIENLEKDVGENRGRINSVEDDTLKNTTDLQRAKVVLAGIGSGFMALLGKLLGIIKL